MIKKLLICLLSTSTLLYSQAVWTGEESELNLSPHLPLYEDASGELTVEEILSNPLAYPFKVKGNAVLNFGFTDSDFWFKLDMKNQTSQNLILEVAGPHIKFISFYKVENGRVAWKKESGYHIPVNQKTLKHHFQLFELNDSIGSYIVKMSPSPQPVPVRLYSKSQYEIKSYRQRLIFGFYIGFMAFVILSNLFFFYSLKNRLFLFYSGIALIYLSYAAFVVDGFIGYFIDDVDINFWYRNIPSFGVIAQLIYGMIFLELRKYSPKHHKIISLVAGYFILWFFVKFFFEPPAVHAINTLNAFVSFFSMFYIGYITGKKGNRLGYYFAAAYFIYFTLVLIEGAYIQFGKPGYLAELSHVTWATLIEAFILSFLLSKRFEWEKKEAEEAKIIAQQEVIEKTLENEKIIKEQNIILEAKVDERTNELKKSYDNLKSTQDKLVQSEKLASLGELTAGIAHEIQNPLNFVNNFSDLNLELIDEVNESYQNKDFNEMESLLADLSLNMTKIHHHGKRAGSIVKSMLMHSRSSSGQKEKLNLNELCEEYTKLAFHGFKAKDRSFNANYSLDLDENLPQIMAVNQEMGRVLLNLVSNAFYAVSMKFRLLAEEEKADYKPKVTVKSKLLKKSTGDEIQISISDNGLGIPKGVQNKIFQPFFTTKPAGEGTGLGLSLVFDIIKSFNGNIQLKSTENVGTTFEINLPVMPQN